jgi:hypothetical protein
MLLHPTFTGFANGLERRRDLIYEAEKWRRLRVASLRCTRSFRPVPRLPQGDRGLEGPGYRTLLSGRPSASTLPDSSHRSLPGMGKVDPCLQE